MRYVYLLPYYIPKSLFLFSLFHSLNNFYGSNYSVIHLDVIKNSNATLAIDYTCLSYIN